MNKNMNTYLYSKTYQNAIITPCIQPFYGKHDFIHGVYDENMQLIEESNLCYSSIKPEKVCHCINKDVIYGGIFFNHFRHFILESLGTLWYIKKCKFKDVVWTFSNSTFIQSWQYEIFDFLKIKNPFLFNSVPTRYKSIDIVFPSTILLLEYYSQDFIDSVSFFQPLSKKKGRKIYLSRTQLSNTAGGITNECELEKLLIRYGFEIFHPQHHSLRIQLETMSSADVVFGIESSAFHSIVFLKECKTKFITLSRKMHNAYYKLAHYASLNYISLDILEKKKNITIPLSKIQYDLDLNLLEDILKTTDCFFKDVEKIKFIAKNPTQNCGTVSYSLPLKKIKTSIPTIKSFEREFYNAKIALTKEKKVEAYEILKKIIPTCFESTKFLHSIVTYCNLCCDLRSDDNIEYILHKIIQLDPVRLDSYWKFLVRFYMAHNNFLAAISFLENKIKRNNKCRWAYSNLLNIYRKRYEFEVALDLLTTGIKSHSCWGELYIQLSYIHESKEELDQALDDVYKAIAIEPQYFDHKKRLTNLLRKKGDFDAAIAVMNAVIELNPYWSEPYYQFSLIHDAKGEMNQAIACAWKATEREPYNLQRKVHLSNLLRKNEDFDAAIVVMNTAMELNPYWSEPHYQFSLIHDAKGEMNQAIACARKATEIEPYNLQRKAHLSNLLRKNEDFDAAIVVMNTAMELNPYWSEPHYQFSLIHDAKGEMNQAITCARKATEIEPYNLQRKAHLSNLLRKNEDFDAAIVVMNTAMELNPYWSEPHYQFSLIHDAKGEMNQAITCARKATEIEPYNLQRKAHLSSLLRKTKQFEQAMLPIREGLELSPRWSDGYIHLSHTHMGMGQLTLAIETAQKALSTHPQPPAYWKKYLDGLLAKRNAISPSSSSPVIARINAYGEYLNARTYLEIGVFKGHTFNAVTIPHKTAVDPKFQFDIERFRSSTTLFYPISSDMFFEQFKNISKKKPYGSEEKPFYFDVIFIDGLHTFEQALCDFENSIPYSHEKTLWIFDDTCPSHCFSALNSSEKGMKWRSVAGLSEDGSWHGDVFKVIFTIHEKYPEFSYCTQINKGNPQTILWKTKSPTYRKKAFQSYNQIVHMRYEDFVENAWVLYLVKDEEVLDKIYSNVDPARYKTGEEYKKVIRRIITDQEQVYAAENKELKDKIAKLEKELFSLTQK